MNEIMTIQNVRAYCDENGTVWLNAADVARGLGFTEEKNGVDNRALIGKLCGFVFADEEYQKQNGDIATRAVVRIPKTVDDIRNGDFTVPPLKKMDASKIKPKTNSGTTKFDSPAPFDDPPFY